MLLDMECSLELCVSASLLLTAPSAVLRAEYRTAKVTPHLQLCQQRYLAIKLSSLILCHGSTKTRKEGSKRMTRALAEYRSGG